MKILTILCIFNIHKWSSRETNIERVGDHFSSVLEEYCERCGEIGGRSLMFGGTLGTFEFTVKNELPVKVQEGDTL